MKRVLVFMLALVAVWAARVPNDLAFIEEINSKQRLWRAGVNEVFEGWSWDEIANLCGSLPEPDSVRLPYKTWPADTDFSNLPDSYDIREEFPASQCPTIHQVRDQGMCGSCWAFGAISAISDRYCIQSAGAKAMNLSAEDMVSCCSSCGMGCNGGWPSSAWSWLKSTGSVEDLCYPYEIPGCDHPCGKTLPTPKCHKKCQPSSGLEYNSDKQHAKSSYSVSSRVEEIKKEIVDNGPVEASFTVYEDFTHYKSGVYIHTSGRMLGGHAVEIIGYGTEGGVPYWLVANSWNAGWGDGGYFKIRQGHNECGIESGIVAGMANV